MIDGVDVTNLIIDSVYNDSIEKTIDTAILKCYPAILDQGVDLDPGSEVTIERGTGTSNTIYLFRGYIKYVSPSTSEVNITCPNKLWALQHREVTKSFDKNIDSEAGVISEIIKTLVTTYGGLNADSDSITSSGTTLTLNKFLCRNDQVFERIMALVDVMGWQLYYNPIDDKVYFEPLGTKTYYKTLSYSRTINDFATTPVVEYDYDQLFNKIVVNGAKQLDTRRDSFTATASQTDFTLTYTPLETEVTVDGVRQLRGVRSSLGDFDYYVEEDLKKVTFQTALTGGESVVITYSAMVPIPVVIDDQTSIDLYCPINPTTGIKTPYQLTVTVSDTIDVKDAEERAKELLSYHATPVVSYNATISPELKIMFPGHAVNINDSINSFSGSLICHKVIRRYPESFDTVFLADKRTFEPDPQDVVNDRLKKLEQEALRNVGVLHHLKNFVRKFKPRRRYFKMQKRDTSSDFLWDRDDWGSNWSSGYTESPVTIRIIQGQGSYKEYFKDTTFIDTSVTTATIDTTNRRAL